MVKINGEPAAAEGMTVAEYLAFAGCDQKRIAVELNGAIVPRAGYCSTLLRDGDSLEIVSFVGGG